MTTATFTRFLIPEIIPSGIPLVGHPRQVKQNEREVELPAISETPTSNTTNDKTLILQQEQLRAQRLNYYLGSIAHSGYTELATSRTAWRAWKDLITALSNRIPVPDAGVGPDGEILYTWNKDEHHFELEIFPNNLGEFFYLNRQTNEAWGYDYEVGSTIPEEVRNRLSPFLLYD